MTSMTSMDDDEDGRQPTPTTTLAHDASRLLKSMDNGRQQQ